MCEVEVIDCKFYKLPSGQAELKKKFAQYGFRRRRCEMLSKIFISVYDLVRRLACADRTHTTRDDREDVDPLLWLIVSPLDRDSTGARVRYSMALPGLDAALNAGTLGSLNSSIVRSCFCDALHRCREAARH